MSDVRYTVCDICGRRLLEKGSKGYLMRGAEGRKIRKLLFGQPDEIEDADVCEECWERIKREVRKEVDHD